MQGGSGGYPPKAEDFILKNKRNEVFSLKVRCFFFTFAWLPNSQNYELVPESLIIIASAPQLLVNK